MSTNTNQEIERRWLVKSYDPGVLGDTKEWGSWSARNITQGYLDKNLRVRRTTGAGALDESELTSKTGRGLVRTELTAPLGRAAAEMLLETTKYKVEKTRFPRCGVDFTEDNKYQYRKWELDLFRGPLNGLVILEREFDTVGEAKSAVLPSFIFDAVEVTDTINNRQLAKLAYILTHKGEPTPPASWETMLAPTIPRIVLTGAPCSGKTTTMRALAGHEWYHCVPETATIVMGQVKVTPSIGLVPFQSCIRKVQTSFEDAAIQQAQQNGKRAVIFDRGTLDSAAFVGGPEVYARALRADIDEEMSRYDAVIMLSPSPKAIFEKEKGNNPIRGESYEDAIARDQDLRQVWEKHPNFRYITENRSWGQKLEAVLNAIGDAIVAKRS